MIKMKNNDPDSNRIKSLIFYLLPVLLYAVLILYLSFLPVGNEPPPEEPPEEDGGENGYEPPDSEPAKSLLFMKYNFPCFDELGNMSLYLCFGLLIYRSLRHYIPIISEIQEIKIRRDFDMQLKLLGIVFILGLIFSSLNELGQTTIASRVADINDIGYNVIGTIIGAFIFIIWDRRKKKLKI